MFIKKHVLMKSNIKNLCKAGFVIILLAFLGLKSKAADQQDIAIDHETAKTVQVNIARK